MYRVMFVAGPGLDERHSRVVLGGDNTPNGATKEQVLECLRTAHSEEGWGDELEYDHYRHQHEWGAAQLALFEQCGMPICVPVRHGAYAVCTDVS